MNSGPATNPGRADAAAAPAAPGSPRYTAAALLLSTFFGTGFFPLGPGTLASALTVALFVLMWPAALSPLWLLPLAALVFVPFVWAAAVAATHFRKKDPGGVVLDEVLGQMISLAAIPTGQSGAAGWKYWLLGFILFRIFDIAKPFPAGRIERWPGGWGIMADDCCAGLYAFAAVYLAVSLGA